MLWETIRLAVQAIFRNALRSFLTVLGIVIGVAAVIAMVTVGQGSTEQVTADVEKLGTNILMVLPGQDAMEGGPGATTSQPFTLRDNDALQDQLAIVDISAPLAVARARAVFGNENRRTDIVGTDNRYFVAARWEVASGRLFELSEIQSGRPVCVDRRDRAQGPVRLFRPGGRDDPDQDPVLHGDRAFAIQGRVDLRKRSGRFRDHADQDIPAPDRRKWRCRHALCLGPRRRAHRARQGAKSSGSCATCAVSAPVKTTISRSWT